MEIWKDIKGYEGYQVSNIGRVRTHNKVTYDNLHGKRKWKDRILKFKKENYSSLHHKQGMGYRVDLWKDGKPHTKLVHRLVADTFLGNYIDTKMTVNHKDGNRYNNNVDNLEWLSLSDNINYGFDKGQYKTNKPIKIKCNDEILSFRSMKQASEYLSKNSGYIWNLIKLNKKSFTIKNIAYEII